MTLSERIEKDYIEAYKGRQATRVGVLRLLKTAAKNRLVELMRTHGTLEDAEMLEVITRQAKQRQDSIDQFTAANRPDLAEKEAQELAILREYLPAALTGEELASVISSAIAATGASGPRDMGRVMGKILGEYKGRVDGKALSEAVKQALAAS